MSVNTFSDAARITSGGSDPVPDAARSDTIHAALARFRSIDGLVIACLVEPDSAHLLAAVSGTDADSAPDHSPQSPASSPDDATALTVAAGASDVIQVVALMTSSLGDLDELEDVIITLGHHHYLIKPLPDAGADGLLIVLDLDRSRTNLARARQQLRALGPLFGPATEPGRDS